MTGRASDIDTGQYGLLSNIYMLSDTQYILCKIQWLAITNTGRNTTILKR